MYPNGTTLSFIKLPLSFGASFVKFT